MARCFLGWELTAESRAYLTHLLGPLQRRFAEAGAPLRWVLPENLHATLLFFPDLTDEERAAVWSGIAQATAAGEWGNLAFAWQGFAPWPSPTRPNLLCLEAAPYPGSRHWPLTQRLVQPPYCKGEVAHLLNYVPHITLMRWQRRRGAGVPGSVGWGALQPQLPPFDGRAIRFDRLSFFLSARSPASPIYLREQTLALAG